MRPPTVSRTPAIPISDASGTVAPFGISAAGHANSFAVPYVKKANAAMTRRTLRKYGADERQRAVRLSCVICIAGEKIDAAMPPT
jgi:hypothetical protein